MQAKRHRSRCGGARIAMAARRDTSTMQARRKAAGSAQPDGVSPLSQRRDMSQRTSALAAAASAAAVAARGGDVRSTPRVQPSLHSRMLHLAVDVAATQAALRQCIAAAERRSREIVEETRGGSNGGASDSSDAVDRMRSVLARAKRSMLLLMAGQRRTVRQFCVDEGISPALLPRLYADPAERRRKRRAAAAAKARGAGHENDTSSAVDTPPHQHHSRGSARGSGEHVPTQASSVPARASRRGEAADYAPSPAVRGVVAPEPATPAGATPVSSWELRMLHRTRRHLKHRIREYVGPGVGCCCGLRHALRM